MRTILEQIPDDHSVLLMYLMDELPASQRQLVERRLENEPSLKAELEKLRAAHETFLQEMTALDRSQPLPADGGLRKVTRTIRQWQVDRARADAHQGGRAWLGRRCRRRS